jgi:hypothetical protein
MQFYSLSLADIENDLVDYFSSTFHDDPSVLTPATDVRKMYNYTGQSWAELADALSDQTWMRNLGVVLAQGMMSSISTIAQLALLIQKHIKHVVASSAPFPVTPMAPLMKAARLAAPSTGAAAAVPSRAGRRSRRAAG